MTTAADPTFVDANVIVYAASLRAPLHGTARQALADLERAGVTLCTSRQVLREYLAVMSRPQTVQAPVPASLLVADVRSFEQRFRIAEDGPAVTSELLTLIASVPVGGKQIHDANIVATMIANGLKRLLTHNVTDFARYAAWVDVVPLVPTP